MSLQTRSKRPDAKQPRAAGTANVSVRADTNGVSRLAGLRQSGSMKAIFPRTYRTGVETVLINTAGGITGGDRFDLQFQACENADLTITTQAAERAYRAQPGEVAQVTSRIDVADNASVAWLPQELILYNHAALHRRLSINLAPAARLLLVEPVVFGRIAMDERLCQLTFRDRIKINRDSGPIYIDGMDLVGDAAQHLSRATIAKSAGALANVVMVAPDAAAQLASVRQALRATAGASMLADDLLVIRILATDSFDLRCTLIPILETLSRDTLPMSWRL